MISGAAPCGLSLVWCYRQKQAGQRVASPQLLQQLLAETDCHGHYTLQGTMLPCHLVGRHADILKDEGTMEEEDVVPARMTMG